MDIAFLGGTFDILHPGHLEFLQWAKEKFGYVVIGLNTDEFVTEYKGRPPIFDYHSRKICLESCRYVDEVLENHGSEKSLPTILLSGANFVVAGNDWGPPERYARQLGLTEEILNKYELKVVICPLPCRFHSFEIKKKISKLFKNEK